MADAELNARLRELEHRIDQLLILVKALEIRQAQAESQALLIRTSGSPG